ncbi:hypothetical protein IMZ48_25015 [Candidatus Bathyarchaeota archaeon]|nr:hypothetical protein [Candidatus Bathyarchaeota archaeon]
MRGLFRGRAYPGHGPPLDDGPAKILEYIQHRKKREAQILEVLNSQNPDGGDWGVMEIVRVVYKDVPEELHVPASGGVVQILRKLEGEGRVSCDRNMWKL